jgi:copper chaperone
VIPASARNPLPVSPDTFTGYRQYHYRVYDRGWHMARSLLSAPATRYHVLRGRTEGTAVSETLITVAGMTCGHCVSAVQGEIGKLAGVSAVEVGLETGSVRVIADPMPGRAALRAAVAEAGYELTG